MNISSQTKVLHSRALVADMHAHPSLKIYMFNKKFHKRYWSGGAFNPFAMRVDLPKCIEGGLNLLFSSVYLPEKGLLKDCWILNLASYVAPCKWRDMLKKNPFEQTNKILDAFERAVARSKINGKEVAEIAYSLADVHRILNAGKIVILHTLEGAHPLDGKIENLKKFYDRGVCSLTLAHFYENRVVFPTDGIPANMKILCCFGKEKDLDKGLTEFGNQMVDEMLNLGMLIDLTHATPKAREEIYQIHKNHSTPRPLVVSHVGVTRYYDNPYNLTDREIKTIADSGGAIGVIFMNYWLKHPHQKYGMQYIVDTLKHLQNVGGSDCPAIGTDFDGFTDPPDDLKDMSQLPLLTDALSKAGFSSADIEKILGENILRVLQNGWGKQ